MFKYILLTPLILSLCACATLSESSESNNEVEQQETTIETGNDVNYRVIGIVRINESGCDFCIETKVSPDKTELLYPVNLDQKYQREGMKLKFDYQLVEQEIPENCPARHAIKMNDVSLMR